MSEIRNVALVGHGDAGKTTLMEHLLAAGKAISRAGSVNDGNTVSDYEDEEHERKSSVQIGVGHTAWKKAHLNLLDAPGYSDFLGEAFAALSAAETALICIPAGAAIPVGARRAWGFAEKMGLARAIVITKADHENAKIEETVGVIRESEHLRHRRGRGAHRADRRGGRRPHGALPRG
jgi:elongation factor G